MTSMPAVETSQKSPTKEGIELMQAAIMRAVRGFKKASALKEMSTRMKRGCHTMS